MRAESLPIFLLLVVAGCRNLERDGAMPLPENAEPITYVEMLSRARGQASSAMDAFYLDAWLEVEQAGKRLEQSARLLPRTKEIPDALKSKVTSEAEALRVDAVKLQEAARTRDAAGVNETMRRINQRVRELRGTTGEKK